MLAKPTREIIIFFTFCQAAIVEPNMHLNFFPHRFFMQHGLKLRDKRMKSKRTLLFIASHWLEENQLCVTHDVTKKKNNLNESYSAAVWMCPCLSICLLLLSLSACCSLSMILSPLYNIVFPPLVSFTVLFESLFRQPSLPSSLSPPSLPMQHSVSLESASST